MNAFQKITFCLLYFLITVVYNRTDILKEGFLAPEQQMMMDLDKEANSTSSHSFPKFDERADIFKIADVAVHIITGGTYKKPDSVASGTKVQKVPNLEFLEEAKKLLYSEKSELARILSLCRNRNPERRPDAYLIKTVLQRVILLRIKKGLN